MRRLATPSGFTLLEVVIALAMLGLALMAIFDLNAGAVASHAYAKRLTVATLLARSKMTDLEQKLYDDGLPSDDDEDSGDFGEQGWPNYKWKARILAPRTQDVSSDQVLSALMGLPVSGEGGGLSSLFSGAAAKGAAGLAGAGAGGPLPPGATAGSAAGMGMGMLQGPVNQLVNQLTKSVREVHLSVTWKDGNHIESVDVVTHVVSLGPGSDRNAPTNPVAAAAAAAGVPGASGAGTVPGAPGAGFPGGPTAPQIPGIQTQPRLPGLFNPPGGVPGVSR